MTIQRRLIDAIYSDDESQVRAVVEAGGKVAVAYNGLMPLVEAARFGSLDIVKLLLKLGANIEQTEPLEEHTALSVACAEAQLKVVQYLIELGADVNYHQKRLSTPLRDAASGGEKKRTKIVELLLQRGAEPNPVFYSQFGNPVSCLIIDICDAANTDTVQMIIDAGADVNSLFLFGTPLTSAVDAGRADLVELLLRNKANPKIKLKEDSRISYLSGKNALEIAQYKKNKKIIKMLEPLM